jgi:hypothetical protein
MPVQPEITSAARNKSALLLRKKLLYPAVHFSRGAISVDIDSTDGVSPNTVNPSVARTRRYLTHPSSASENSVARISMPSAFAVLRLMTRLNFVGCWTGNRPAFPLQSARL